MKNLMAFVLSATLVGVSPAVAQDDNSYPTRPVHLVVGYPAGLAPDITARLVARALSQRIGREVIVDNRPGAGSNIGSEMVAHAAPDGHTLLALTFANAINATLYEKLNFDIERDITPVIAIFRTPTVLVAAPSFPAKTVAELIAYAKANPGKVNYASAGFGTVNNVAGEMFNAAAGIDLVHVPYRGSYVPDLLGGQIQLTFAPVTAVIGYIKAGSLRALAVTSAERLETLAGVPTVGEFLPGYEASVWHGIGVPRNTPPRIVSKLNAAVNAILADPATREHFAELGGTPIGGSPEAFGALIREEIAKWRKVIRTSNIRPE